QRDLAEAVAGVHDVEDDFFSLRGYRAHFDGAAQHRHHALPWRAFGEDLVTGRIPLDPRIGEQSVDLLAAQFPEQEMTLKDPPLFLKRGVGHDIPPCYPGFIINVLRFLVSDYLRRGLLKEAAQPRQQTGP